MDRPLVEIRDLHKSFGKIEVLKGVEGISFTFFQSGDVVRHPLVAEMLGVL